MDRIVCNKCIYWTRLLLEFHVLTLFITFRVASFLFIAWLYIHIKKQSNLIEFFSNYLSKIDLVFEFYFYSISKLHNFLM